MKFSTISIRPGGIHRGSWEVTVAKLPYDREDVDHGPHSLGFYHYPRSKTAQQAFDQLKALLVQRHVDEIAALTKSLAKLNALELPHGSR